MRYFCFACRAKIYAEMEQLSDKVGPSMSLSLPPPSLL